MCRAIADFVDELAVHYATNSLLERNGSARKKMNTWIPYEMEGKRMGEFYFILRYFAPLDDPASSLCPAQCMDSVRP